MVEVKSEVETKPLTPEERRRQGSLFGQELKDANLAAHELNHRSDLEAARMIRDRLALDKEFITADDVREVFERSRPGAWGPWAGALFRGKEYQPVPGHFVPSAFATNHGAVIRVWQRKK